MRRATGMSVPPTPGNDMAMNNLGRQYADFMQPADLDAARHWWERAADAGNSNAMFNLGHLHAELMQPPDLDGARHWWERAADTEAQRGHVQPRVPVREFDSAAGSGRGPPLA